MGRDLKIKTRLFIGFGSLITLAAIISFVSYISISILSNDIDDLSKRRVPQTVWLGNITEALTANTVALQKAFLAEDKESMEKAIAEMGAIRKTINDNFDKVKASLTTEKGRELFQIMLDKRKPVADTRDQAVKMLRDGKKKEALLMLQKLEPMQQDYAKAVHDLNNLVQDITKTSREKAESNAKTSGMVLIVLGIFAAGIAVFITLWIVRSITKPLNEAIDTAERIAAGDLTTVIAGEGNNETGKLLIAMKTMVERLRVLIGDIKQASSSVASGSEQLSASSEEITRTMTSQSSRSSQIAASSEEMSQTVLDIAKNAADIAESSSKTADIARTGAEVVNKSVSESKTVSEIVDKSEKVIRTLGEKSKQIGAIVAVINDIADQTNLLALNAAIEAARAGEQGRGFAVVADEVRKLAERTGKATAEIGQMIGAIQGEIDNAVNSMSRTTERVNVGLQYSVEAGDQLTAIVQSVTNLQTMVQQIAAATEQMSTSSEAISADIQAVASGAKEASDGADQIAQSSSELARLAGHLKNTVDQFKS